MLPSIGLCKSPAEMPSVSVGSFGAPPGPQPIAPQLAAQQPAAPRKRGKKRAAAAALMTDAEAASSQPGAHAQPALIAQKPVKGRPLVQGCKAEPVEGKNKDGNGSAAVPMQQEKPAKRRRRIKPQVNPDQQGQVAASGPQDGALTASLTQVCAQLTRQPLQTRFGQVAVQPMVTEHSIAGNNELHAAISIEAILQDAACS